MVIRVVFASGATVRFRPPRDTLPLYSSLAFLVNCCSIFKAGLTFCFCLFATDMSTPVRPLSSTWSPGPGSSTRFQVAFDAALQRLGYDPKNRGVRTTVPESALREAAVFAMAMVRSVGRLAAEYGAIDGSYEMNASKGEVVVILQGGRHVKCNVCKAWNSNKQRWCGGCRKRTYCGSHCQKADWSAHKPDCICRGPGWRIRQRLRLQERLRLHERLAIYYDYLGQNTAV